MKGFLMIAPIVLVFSQALKLLVEWEVLHTTLEVAEFHKRVNTAITVSALVSFIEIFILAVLAVKWAEEKKELKSNNTLPIV